MLDGGDADDDDAEPEGGRGGRGGGYRGSPRVGEAAAVAMETKSTPPAVFTPPAWLMATVVKLRFWFPLVTLAGAAAAVVILLQPRWRARRELAWPALLCLVSVTILFLQVLTLAMVTVTEGRYSDALRTLAVFSLVCALATVGALATDLIAGVRRRRALRTTLAA